MSCPYCHHCRATDKYENVTNVGVQMCHRIIGAVAELYQQTQGHILGKLKGQRYARPRFIAYYLARELTNLSFPEIAEVFNRDHSTIVHGYQFIAREILKRPIMSAEVRRLKTELSILAQKKAAA